jgi:MoaA/NifB/PqqE/SkfB family radical SAM enzyme
MPVELLAQAESGIESPGADIVSLPILLLNVHEHCNCRCLMCDIWQRKDGKELDLVDFERHRASIVRLGVRQVVLTGGEPLLHRNIEGLFEFLRGCNVSITLLTTGLLLSKRADVVAANVDEIIISLDGPEEVHDRVRRVNGAYRLIGEGIRAVRQRKVDMPVHGRCTVQKENHSLLRKTIAGAKFLGMDSISFLAADVTSQAFNRELVWPGERQSQVVLTRQEVEALEEEIASLTRENDEDMRTKYISESAEKLWRIARRFREQLGEMPPVAPLCNAPWVSAVMEVDGSVRPCFFHRKIGSTREQTLEQVINGQEARRFRTWLDVSENAICQRCVCSLNYKGQRG